MFAFKYISLHLDIVLFVYIYELLSIYLCSSGGYLCFYNRISMHKQSLLLLTLKFIYILDLFPLFKYFFFAISFHALLLFRFYDDKFSA